MKFKDYVKKFNLEKYEKVTFLVVKAEKDEHTPFYHSSYVTTPIRNVSEWMESDLSDYHILNDHQPPIDWSSGANWGNSYNKGWLRCMLIISDEQIHRLYSEEQATGIIDFCAEKFKR